MSTEDLSYLPSTGTDTPALLPSEESLPPHFAGPLFASEHFGRQVTHHRVINPTESIYNDTQKHFSTAMKTVPAYAGIPALYSHQAWAIDCIRVGLDVAAATRTASGKLLIYYFPIVDRFLYDLDTMLLFIFYFKVLIGDHVSALFSLTAYWVTDVRPRVAIVDGDTSARFRKKIREHPPQVLSSSHDMLRQVILPHHQRRWITCLASLSFADIDAMHNTGGRAHMAQVIRRLLRVAGLFSSGWKIFRV